MRDVNGLENGRCLVDVVVVDISMSSCVIVNFSDLGASAIQDLAEQDLQRPPTSDALIGIVNEQVATFQSQVDELLQLREDYVSAGGRHFFCEVLESGDAPPAVSAKPTFFAEALYDVLDHRGRVRSHMMDSFLDLCQRTNPLHQRAVLIAVVENFSKDDFLRFVKDSSGSTRGLQVFNRWVVAPTQVGEAEYTDTARHVSWCLQLTARVLTILSQQITSDSRSDMVFWRSLLPEGAKLKNHPLAKILRSINKAFKKGIFGGATGARRKSLFVSHKTYGYEKLMKLLMGTASKLIVEAAPVAAAAPKKKKTTPALSVAGASSSSTSSSSSSSSASSSCLLYTSPSPRDRG